MDTEKCAALLCALEEGTLARAAERLGYTPSGISRMVAALEEELGFPLLYRSRGGVTATGECEALLGAMDEYMPKFWQYLWPRPRPWAMKTACPGTSCSLPWARATRSTPPRTPRTIC